VKCLWDCHFGGQGRVLPARSPALLLLFRRAVLLFGEKRRYVRLGLIQNSYIDTKNFL